MMGDRQAFEKWAGIDGHEPACRQFADGSYTSHYVNTRWVAWQAAYQAGIAEGMERAERAVGKMDSAQAVDEALYLIRAAQEVK